MTALRWLARELRVWWDLVTLKWITSADGLPSFSKLVISAVVVWVIRKIPPELSLLFLALIVLLATLTYGWKGVTVISSWVLAKINAPKGEP